MIREELEKGVKERESGVGDALEGGGGVGDG